ncbi:hypothetical protein TrRE_jg13259 [Triparma retinervis]|uniref:Uncharacterized protein n=1 Tax=Triparma retinervis TaxID=2557542 RepID=A0A9W7F6K6_9STRA|nr:hypothetical protein TrRE_jg13259 [Triparma retinervis]
MLSRIASRVPSRVVGMQKRNMGGKMGVKKNFHVEEWNGKREITEKTFEFGPNNVPWLIGTCVAFPLFVYYWTRSEMEERREFKGRVL